MMKPQPEKAHPANAIGLCCKATLRQSSAHSPACGDPRWICPAVRRAGQSEVESLSEGAFLGGVRAHHLTGVIITAFSNLGKGEIGIFLLFLSKTVFLSKNDETIKVIYQSKKMKLLKQFIKKQNKP